MRRPMFAGLHAGTVQACLHPELASRGAVLGGAIATETPLQAATLSLAGHPALRACTDINRCTLRGMFMRTSSPQCAQRLVPTCTHRALLLAPLTWPARQQACRSSTRTCRGLLAHILKVLCTVPLFSSGNRLTDSLRNFVRHPRPLQADG